ncbi:MAG: type IX secretion system membrane protein PorP/SprF [Bacteroidota bacterium]|nr:type IX secretion system membrane protein PorP/SprF [Bacteroidota bacterium]MEC8759272.1 type IX secretion system membrane protein PorP/SprF [Bacteroidota bacterium]MED5335359.1 type IX secretion system membrane protein PorP/SprF [Bacteroidota bacterium]
MAMKLPQPSTPGALRALALPVLALMLTCIGTLTPETASAQDPEFTQFYSNPVYLNPAFAGAARCPRFVMNYRNQWPAMSGNYVTSAAAYDQHIPSISGGLGFIVMNDRAGRGTLSTSRISGIYSYQQAVSRKFSIKAGFEATYFQKALDWSQLTFGDMIDPRKGFIYETQDQPRGGKVSQVDFSAGIIGFSKKVYFGFAAHHLNEPNESLVVGVSRLPMKLTAHFGALLPLDGDSKYASAFISPNVLYRRQGEFQQMNFGAYVSKGPIVGGIWYRGILGTQYRDAFIVTLGIQSDVIKFGYSYDVTVSDLTPATGGSHEVSMSLNFDCRAKRIKFRSPPCPGF